MFQVDEAMNEADGPQSQPTQATEATSNEKIAETLQEKIELADLCKSIFETSILTEQQKSKLSVHLKVDSNSTPIAADAGSNTPKVAVGETTDNHAPTFSSTNRDGGGEDKKKQSQTRKHAAKGSDNDDKDNDLLRVRKQEEIDERRAQELINIARALKANSKYIPYEKVELSVGEKDNVERNQPREVDDKYKSWDSLDSDESSVDRESIHNDNEDSEEFEDEDCEEIEEEDEEDEDIADDENGDNDEDDPEDNEDESCMSSVLDMLETMDTRDSKKKRKRTDSQGDSSDEEAHAPKITVIAPSKGLDSSSKTTAHTSPIKTPPKADCENVSQNSNISGNAIETINQKASSSTRPRESETNTGNKGNITGLGTMQQSFIDPDTDSNPK